MAQAPPPKYSSDSEYDTAANCKLREELIKLKLREYERTGAKDSAERRRLQREILDEMRYLAAYHPDAATRTYWAEKTRTFDNAAAGGSEEEKAHVLMDVGRGLGMIIVAPFRLVGEVLQGVGTVVKGLGTFFSGGKFGQ
ncbi:MFS general substrate transporter [Mycena chlorophos]|uniref:MFS general substrate transporter n=1 Tax=Mycena chlorophos TaxID=658473 RepID=A0A8H6S8P8_MYCCL|nr:MFS general substrate transporter [Mycena chlorophos]